MKRIIICVIFLLIYRFSFAKEDSCIECHNELEGEFKKPVEMMKSDIHYKFGISCVSCHGGNPTIHDESAMDKKYGFIGVPNKKEILKIC